MQKYFGLILGALIGFAVVACGGSGSDANAGGQADVTQAEFDALVERVEALEAALASIGKPRDTLYAPAASTAANGMQKAAADWVDIGTRLECLPTSEFFGDWCRIISPKGYYFALPLGLGQSYPLQAGRIYFDQAGCTGTPHMYFSDIGPDANTQGFVTGLYPDGHATPTAIYMSEVGNTVKTNTVMQSYIDAPYTPCVNFTTDATSYFELVDNDPDVSGVSNDNYGELSLLP